MYHIDYWPFKCIEDILNIYEKEKVIQERNDIIKQLECEGLSQEQINILENKQIKY